MTGKRFLSIAEIAREVEAPESTLHYWKNRYAAFLPSVGQGRQKRFRPEAVEVFRLIAALLRDGHAPAEVAGHLARTHAVNPASVQEAGFSSSPGDSGPGREAPDPVALGVQIGTQIGAEVARSLAQGLNDLLASAQAALQAGALALPQAPAGEQTRPQDEDLAALRAENAVFRDKLSVLEAELVRLRKDRREMEKFLLDKIKGVTT